MLSRGQAKRALLRAVLLGVLAALVVVSSSGASTSTIAQTRPLTKVKVAILRLEPVAQAMYAKHRAMFRKQGLDAELVLLSAPTQTVTALLSGQVQFAATHVGAAAKLRSDRAPIRVVAAGAIYDPRKPTAALVSARGKTITRPRDLVGRTVALDGPFTIADLAMREWLRKNGVDSGRVSFTYLPFQDMLAPLAEGRVDAAVVPEPYRTIALQQGSKQVADPFVAVCERTCQLTFWIARADVDPDTVARFRNAIQRAAVWANDDANDEVSGKILARYAPLDANVIARMSRTTFGTRLRVSLAQPWLPVFARYGVIPESFRPIDYVR